MFGSRENRSDYIVNASRVFGLGREPSLCARKEDFGSGENRSVCVERRLFPGR